MDVYAKYRARSPSDNILGTPFRLRRILLVLGAACALCLGAFVARLLKVYPFSQYYDPNEFFDARVSSERVPVTLSSDVHRLFEPPILPPVSQSPRPISAYAAMSDKCADLWIGSGIWDSSYSCSLPHTDLSSTLHLDAVWAWVNGSDPVQAASRAAYAPMHGIVDARHRYTDHGELRYSLRALMGAAGDFVSKIHILASAYPGARSVDAQSRQFIGQRPSWLAHDPSSRVRVHHDAEFFTPIASSIYSNATAQSVAFRRATIPSFNSLSVESQMHNLPEAASDLMIYLNDDFFHLRKHSFADYYSPLTGPVIRSTVDWKSMYAPVEHSWYSRMGETAAIERATWVLSRRFTYRRRPYVTHHVRALSLPLLHEAVSMFPDDFGNTTLARFRADEDAPPGVQTVFLGTWFVPERHREALLWSYLVARWGSVQESSSNKQYPIESIWRHIIQSILDPSTFNPHDLPPSIDIHLPRRAPISNQMFEDAGLDTPKQTKYEFTSGDGYSLGYLSMLYFWDRPRGGWPDFSKQSRRPYLCTLSRTKCFESPSYNGLSANDVFKRFAFEDSECGDCLAAALTVASGEKGLNAFLPPKSETEENTVDTASGEELPSSFRDLPPHLPIGPTWQSLDFSLSNVLSKFDAPSINLRTFCVRLIQRYSYSLGQTPSLLYQMVRTDDIRKKLKMIDENDRVSLLALNDDIEGEGEGVDEVLQSWFKSRWPKPMEWELFE